MKTTIAIAKGILLGAAMIAIASLGGCANRAFPVGPNPLDTPGDCPASAAELHAENMAIITENPARTLW